MNCDAQAGLQERLVVEMTRRLIFIYLVEGAQFAKRTTLFEGFET